MNTFKYANVVTKSLINNKKYWRNSVDWKHDGKSITVGRSWTSSEGVFI